MNEISTVGVEISKKKFGNFKHSAFHNIIRFIRIVNSMGQKQAKLTDLADTLREAVNGLNSISNPYVEKSESFAKLHDNYLEKSGNVLTLRTKLLQKASSVDIRTKLRQLLFEAAVTAQQTLELTKRLDAHYPYFRGLSLDKIEKPFQEKKKREKMREKIQELCVELKEPEQLADALELLRTTADGLRVGYLLRYLASSKAFTKLTAVELVWLKRVSRSAAAANIILCGKHPHIEAESYTGILDESAMLS